MIDPTSTAGMRFHRPRDLHRCEHKSPGSMQYEIDRPILRRLHDRGNDRLRIFKIDVSGDVEPEETALLLPMDHRDDAGFVRRLNGTNGLSAFDRGPPAHQQRLQSHHSNQNPNYA
jgi:hypothetical protein